MSANTWLRSRNSGAASKAPSARRGSALDLAAATNDQAGQARCQEEAGIQIEWLAGLQRLGADDMDIDAAYLAPSGNHELVAEPLGRDTDDDRLAFQYEQDTVWRAQRRSR